MVRSWDEGYLPETRGHALPARNVAAWRFALRVSDTTRRENSESFCVMQIEMSDDQSHV